MPEGLSPDESSASWPRRATNPRIPRRGHLELLYACGLRVSELTGLDSTA